MNRRAFLDVLLTAFACLAIWLRDRGVLDAAETNIAIANLKSARDEIAKARAALSAAISSAILAACATTTASNAPIEHAGFCDVAEPIFWSPRDSDGTIAQVKAHDAVGAALCGWAPGVR